MSDKYWQNCFVYALYLHYNFYSLKPIWRQGSWSTLFQAMACCQGAPSHNLKQYRLNVIKVPSLRPIGTDVSELYNGLHSRNAFENGGNSTQVLEHNANHDAPRLFAGRTYLAWIVYNKWFSLCAHIFVAWRFYNCDVYTPIRHRAFSTGAEIYNMQLFRTNDNTTRVTDNINFWHTNVTYWHITFKACVCQIEISRGTILLIATFTPMM